MRYYTHNFKHVVIKALRAGGYADDAKHVIHADIVGVTDGGNASLEFIVFFDADCDVSVARLYMEVGKNGEWVAEY